MSFQAVQERLAALQETTSQLQALITRLADLKFQPGSVPLDGDSNVSTELSTEIHETLRDQDEDLELLEQQVQDLPAGRAGSESERDKARLIEAVTRASHELKLLHTSFRKAQLSAKRNLAAAQRLERSLLLQSLANPPPSSSASDNGTGTAPIPTHRRNMHSSALKSKDEKLVDATSDVTLALRRTHTLMSAELSRSQFAHDTLRESTAALSQLSESYDSLDSMLASSRNLVRTLLTSQKSDTWYLETAVYVLLATIAWLIFRRFVYGPAWWLVWLPLKLFYKAWMGVFAAVGLRSRNAVVDMGYGEVVREAISSAPVPPVAPSNPVTHRLGTRKPHPSGAPNPHGHHYIQVGRGGGGQGGPRHPDERLSMVQQVGEIIDESQQIHEAQADAEADGKQEPVGEDAPNPKKRMWEEDKENAKHENRKDEL